MQLAKNGVMQPVSRQWIGKHDPMPTQQQSYFWKRCFLLKPCKVVMRKTIGATQLFFSFQLRLQFCTGGCEDRI
jgi:hypothetical protein